MTIEAWFLPSIIAVLFWGTTGVLAKLSLRTLRPFDLIIFNVLFFFIFVAAAQFFSDGLEFDIRGAALAVGIGIAGACGQILSLYALRHGPLTTISMIGALYPIVAMGLSFVILDEAVTLRQGAGIALGIIAILILARADERSA